VTVKDAATTNHNLVLWTDQAELVEVEAAAALAVFVPEFTDDEDGWDARLEGKTGEAVDSGPEAVGVPPLAFPADVLPVDGDELSLELGDPVELGPDAPLPLGLDEVF
jgi:hypothetical protein